MFTYTCSLYFIRYVHTVCILQDIYILFCMIFTYSGCIWHAVISRFSGELQSDLDLYVFIVMIAIFVMFHVVYLITVVVKVNTPRINIFVVALEVNYLDWMNDLSLLKLERIGGVMVSVLASDAVDRGFEPRSGQTKDYKIGSCCFSSKHAALRKKCKDWLPRNQDNVSEWGDLFISELLFQIE